METIVIPISCKTVSKANKVITPIFLVAIVMYGIVGTAFMLLNPALPQNIVGFFYAIAAGIAVLVLMVCCIFTAIIGYELLPDVECMR